ncbi:hypothetical protein SDC9_201570 [bioreactor metagenome]|uniref:Dystroglycan-type cadherin-like domain-containing protein n=1 Tax=bioreactor metagenome TaxID=1076179 RepID=A0A645ISV8_9ZZZZ
MLGTSTIPASTEIIYYDITISSVQSDTSIVSGMNFSYLVETLPEDATISVSGASWLNVGGHLVYGTVTELGEYIITVTAYKDDLQVDTQTFTITVVSSLIFTSGPEAGRIVLEAE